LFGGGHGGHGGGQGSGDHGDRDPGNGGQAPTGAPAAIDPVSRNPVDPARAPSSFYGGRVYYFESAETRTKFEAAPSSYASSQPEQQQPSRHRHGGC
jgi:YHS domain-containing protein